MFTKDFFDYSYCYQFSHLLNNIINNEEQVYHDIINQIDLYNFITVSNM